MIQKNEIPQETSQPTITQKRGKHRIYIGMAPGVGKTYRMLEEAKALKEEGLDVVVGLLETHGREETEAAAIGLEILPRQKIDRGGVIFDDMDTNAILARQPQLVLIDELAHTNIPGLERQKRYEDVEIVLESGIDVFSTVNIQHLESLNDIVAKITGVVVRERVPDRLLDEADEVIVVDVTPETLQERLQEGKIYAAEKIEQSLQNFFQLRHLIALRELALREVADNVELDAEETQTPGTQICSIKERVLVCVSTYPHSVKLLRRGARLAHQMRARLYGLYINHPDRFLTRDESRYIEMCEQLCKEMGGEFLRTEHPQITQGIAEIARQYNITQIVLGQTKKSRLQLFFHSSPIQQLMRHLKDVDLHIIATQELD